MRKWFETMAMAPIPEGQRCSDRLQCIMQYQGVGLGCLLTVALDERVSSIGIMSGFRDADLVDQGRSRRHRGL